MLDSNAALCGFMVMWPRGLWIPPIAIRAFAVSGRWQLKRVAEPPLLYVSPCHETSSDARYVAWMFTAAEAHSSVCGHIQSLK